MLKRNASRTGDLRAEEVVLTDAAGAFSKLSQPHRPNSRFYYNPSPEEIVPPVSGEIKVEKHFYVPAKFFVVGRVMLIVIADIIPVLNVRLWPRFCCLR